MATSFSISKTPVSKLRKLPFLPRIGLVVDAFGVQMTLRHAPLLETLIVARERGKLNVKGLANAAADLLDDVRMPAMMKRALATVKVMKNGSPKIVKKNAPRAAAKKKVEEAPAE